jgi:glycosyltransferase involved in cell wall biosynthesis
MASGLGVVAYRDAAAAELITSNVDGICVTPDDETAFIEAACRLAGDRQLLAACREAAQRRVSAITWDAVIGEFESVLHAAASGALSNA